MYTSLKGPERWVNIHVYVYLNCVIRHDKKKGGGFCMKEQGCRRERPQVELEVWVGEDLMGVEAGTIRRKARHVH